MAKRVLFICYWSINDNLTIATVLPRLKILQARNDIETVTLVTIERDKLLFSAKVFPSDLFKVRHQPFMSGKHNGSILEKINDFIRLPKWLNHLVVSENLNTIFAHSAPSGALAYKVWEKLQIPFYVSSFEPHAAYMVESGVWGKYSLKYLFQNYWENNQKKFASGLMPVANSYTEKLIKEGVPAARIFTVPCSVNTGDFKFDLTTRTQQREKLSWQQGVIGIYAGKFGGLYYDKDAYHIFQQCFKLILNFRLIILTPDGKNTIEQNLLDSQIDISKVFVAAISHQDVPQYLSTADFAFATYKPGLSKKYLSPVKVGEYWASGLPVLLTEGTGDDSDIIKSEGGGALFNLEQEGSLERAIQQIQQIIKDPTHRQEIPKLAQKYRSPEKIKEAYDYFFGTLETDE